VVEVAPLKFGAVFKQAFSQVEVFKQFVKIHDHSQPYPRSTVNKIFGYAVAN